MAFILLRRVTKIGGPRSPARLPRRTKLTRGPPPTVDVVNLPEIGSKGNSHLLMMDKNDARAADLIQKWLADQGRSSDFDGCLIDQTSA